MKRSELASKYHTTKDTKDYNNYKKQRNFCSKLYKKDRKKFYINLNIKHITDNKKFWKTLKLLVNDKGTCGSSKINLVVDDKNLSDEIKIVEAFNNYFNNTVKSLNLRCDPEHLNDISDKNDLIEIAIKMFKNHSSIVNISQMLYQLLKKKTQLSLRTIAQSVFYQLPSRFLRELCLIKLPLI